MECAMNAQTISALLLRVRLALAARGPVWCAGVLLIVLGAGMLAWLAPQGARSAAAHAEAMRSATLPASARAPAPVSANENLALFYATLGEKKYAEQQVKTLFGLAAKAGLSLSQGEYKAGYDQGARLSTYQVTLPVKGSYRQIWQFGLAALRDIPFASLDEISFKREAIGEANLEARLRLTFYLAERGTERTTERAGGQP
jgi:hypothetical protein